MVRDAILNKTGADGTMPMEKIFNGRGTMELLPEITLFHPLIIHTETEQVYYIFTFIYLYLFTYVLYFVNNLIIT